MKKFKIAIVGATGAVGREMLRCVFQFNFPFESIKLLASARSAEKKSNLKDINLLLKN